MVLELMPCLVLTIEYPVFLKNIYHPYDNAVWLDSFKLYNEYIYIYIYIKY